MTIVLEQDFLLMVFAAIGYGLSKAKIANSSHSKLLSALCLYLFLPSKVFSTFATRFTPAYLSQKYHLLIAATIIIAVAALVAIPVSRLLTKNSYRRNIYHYSLTLSNSGYIGYALAEGIFGGEMLLDVMMFAFPVGLYNYTIAYCMLTKSDKPWKKLLNPVTCAMVLGAIVGITGFELPELVNTFLSRSSACMSPLSMLLMGIVISDYKLKDLLKGKVVYLIVAMRLLVIPCSIGFILKLLNLDSLIIPSLMILAMPCGMNTIIFPKLVGEDCAPGASLTFISTILCCLTIPLCLFLFSGIA